MKTDEIRTIAPNAHGCDVSAVANALGVDIDIGLASDEARARLEEFGPNRLAARRRRNVLLILVSQLKSPVVWLLLAAAALATSFRETPEAIAIGVVLAVNTAIGFIAEWRAERSMESLRAIGVQAATVRREGLRRMIPAYELVPGDIVLIDAGDVAAADMRLASASALLVDEAALTGESVGKDKTNASVAPNAPLPDRNCMIYKGSAVARGAAVGIVTATGMETELGHISRLVTEAHAKRTPLEAQLGRLGSQLAAFVIAIAVILILGGLAGGRDAILIVQTAIALAVAAIPEGLPIVATLALARGMWRMARRNALVERLAAVETLGAATLICTDKTGTLTENRMTATDVWTSDERLKVSSRQTPPQGTSMAALKAAAMCNDAGFGPDGKLLGDPMETALLHAVRAVGLDIEELKSQEPRLREVPFDSVSKMMATVHRSDTDAAIVYVKGAPEAVLRACDSIEQDARSVLLDETEKSEWRSRVEDMAESGLRVIAVARKRCATQSDEPVYQGLSFLGAIGLEDPPRSDVAAAIADCREAGVRVVMMTGDHAVTARNIAAKVGLTETHPHTVDGADLGSLDHLTQDRREEVRRADIFARVSPAQKFQLVRLHQDAGEVVAMTGDGVNDAPALKQADIGVAMGLRGTQVAREAAAMVLRDDAFSTIVAAIREGRVIFRNIQRFTVYLLSCNLSEVLLIAGAVALGMPLPLTPLQILFLNLVTDVFPAFALGFGAGDDGVMRRRPRDPGKPLLTRPLWTLIVGMGTVIAGATLASFFFARTVLQLDEAQATTVSFLTLALAQLWHVFNMRDPRTSPLRNDIVRNPYVWLALATCVLILGAAVYTPVLSAALSITIPTAAAWALIAVASLAPLIIGQIAKTIALFDHTTARSTGRQSRDSGDRR